MADASQSNATLSILQNGFYHVAGAFFLVLSRVKYMLRGYSSPKPFSTSQLDRCADYDFHIVDQWISALEAYAGPDSSIVGRSVLELGPGSDLGVGLYLLSKGVVKYNALDANDLVRDTSPVFYEHLLDRLGEKDPRADTKRLRDELDSMLSGNGKALNYLCRDDFDIAIAFPKASIDIVFSQAAFEHFDDVEVTIKQLSTVCKPGAVLVAEIDLKTHSRWIRKKDPNNIYRYSDWFYGFLGYSGVPNRVRPCEYKKLFEQHEWQDVQVVPVDTLTTNEQEWTKLWLNPRFRGEASQMHCLSVVLCARRV